MNNARRVFINQVSLMAGVAVFSKPTSLIAAGKSIDILGGNPSVTINHTNDLHGNIAALQQHNATKGLLVDGGGFLNNSHGLSKQKQVIDVMNSMGYLAATIGNNELAQGQDYLAGLIPHMKFSLVNCNYQFDNKLNKLVKPYIIVRSGKLKIGITGVGQQLNNVGYNDAIPSANKVAKLLKTEEKCDLVICLSHLGYMQPDNRPDNRQLANQSEYIDMIISGHNSRLPKGPMVLHNKLQNEIILSQTTSGGSFMGKTVFSFDKNSQKCNIDTKHLTAGQAA